MASVRSRGVCDFRVSVIFYSNYGINKTIILAVYRQCRNNGQTFTSDRLAYYLGCSCRGSLEAVIDQLASARTIQG